MTRSSRGLEKDEGDEVIMNKKNEARTVRKDKIGRKTGRKP
jgi:hypothetical protein